MQKMQIFYDQLFSETVAEDGDRQALARLTRVQPEELAALDEAVTWTDWGVSDRA